MTTLSQQQALGILDEGMSIVRNLCAQLNEEQFVQPKTIGGGDWSAKDLVGHLAFWEELAATALSDVRAGKKPEIEDYFARGAEGIDELNALNQARTTAQSTAIVQARAREAHTALVAAIETMSDDEWKAKVPYEAERRQTIGNLLGSIVGAPKRPFDHASAHIPDLQAYIASVTALTGYFDPAGRSDVSSGGIEMIPIDTPKGVFRVWTKRIGNNPRIKLLLLHGGPGATHEYFEAADSYLPAAGIEYYHYDQLGSAYSEQPDEPELWEIDRFVEEVEQVRKARGLTRDNFFLLGHSWGGILATEYALKYQQHLKGLVISNMMSSVPAYNHYAQTVLMPEMDQALLAEAKALEDANDYENPRYMEILTPLHYEHHVLRMPVEDWPDPVNRAFARINQSIYVPLQGPSELGARGKLENWDRTSDLPRIDVPTLTIGGQHDTMDPKYMEMMAGKFPRGRYLHCPNGSHLAMYDDQETYFNGLIDFLRDVDANA